MVIDILNEYKPTPYVTWDYICRFWKILAQHWTVWPQLLKGLEAPALPHTKQAVALFCLPGLDAPGCIHRDLRNLGQFISLVMLTTTQFPIDLLLSFKCLKLTLAIVTPFSKGIITSPTDLPCARYHVTSAFIVCQEVGKEGPLRSVPPSFSCGSPHGGRQNL